MPQRNFGRILAAIALAATLHLASAAPAAAAPRNRLQDVWTSVMRVLEDRLGALRRAATPAEPGRTFEEKSGPCIDPNGCANQTTVAPASPECSGWDEAGVCIDPNG